jgi:anaerobic dimethyl sulfoxide reductase subunit C
MSVAHEWPLVVFTLAIQLAVGCYLALMLVGGDRTWNRAPLLAVGALTILGLAASALHLGTPGNAVWTLANMGESWLSREILAGVAFLGLWAVRFQVHRRARPARWHTALAAMLAVAGLAVIWAMARVYMLPARPAWDSWLTPASFFLTTLLLGAVAMAARLEDQPWRVPGSDPDAASHAGARAPAGERPGPEAVLLGIGLVAVVAQLVATPFHPVSAALADSGAEARFGVARVLLMLLGAVLLVGALARRRRGGRWALAAFLLLLAAETVGRALFYAAGMTEPF